MTSGLLTGGIAALFSDVFGSIYLDCRIRRVTRATDGVGDITETSATKSAKVQVDAVTEAQRLEAGYAGSDVRLIILGCGQGEINSGDVLTVCGTDYKLGPVLTEDPAKSHIVARGIRI